MGSALVHGDLQGIVVGKVLVPQLDDLAKVRKLAGVRPDFRRGIDAAIVVARGGAGQASAHGARVPPRAKRRLVDVHPSWFLKAMDADVSQVHRQVIGDGALNVQIPLGGVRLTEVRVYRLGGAGCGGVTRRQTRLTSVSAGQPRIGAGKRAGSGQRGVTGEYRARQGPIKLTRAQL